MELKIINKSNNKLPEYSTKGSSGMDLRAYLDEPLIVPPMGRVLIPTGLYPQIPLGYELQIRARSGMSLKHGLTMANGIGTIDSDYRGEIGIIMINLSDKEYTINNGDRVAQMVAMKIEKISINVVDKLESTNRNEGGFGSSGIK